MLLSKYRPSMGALYFFVLKNIPDWRGLSPRPRKRIPNIVAYNNCSWCAYSSRPRGLLALLLSFVIRQFAAWASTVITHKHSQKKARGKRQQRTPTYEDCLLSVPTSSLSSIYLTCCLCPTLPSYYTPCHPPFYIPTPRPYSIPTPWVCVCHYCIELSSSLKTFFVWGVKSSSIDKSLWKNEVQSYRHY